MANIKALYGSDKLREMYPKVNENFTDVNGEVNDLRNRVNTIITTPIDGEAAAQELVDARDNEASLGARLSRDKNIIVAKVALKADKTYVDTEIASVADGTPEAFADQSAIEAAYPTGAPHVKLNLDDGYVWKWNGSAWVQGWVYQATNLDESVADYAVDFLNIPTIQNKLLNGDFVLDSDSNGLADNFTAKTSSGSRTVAIDSEIYKINGKSQKITVTSGSYVLYEQLLTFVAGHKYYIAEWVRCSETTITNLGFRVYSGSTAKKTVGQTSFAGDWKRISTIYEADGTETSISILISNTTNPHASVSGWHDGLMCLDLTEAYGEGNEPILGDMELLLAKYPNSWIDSKISVFDSKIVLQDIGRLNKTMLEIVNPYEIPSIYIPDAIECWWTYPRIIKHNNKLYVGYADKLGDVYISSYDYETRETKKTLLADFSGADDHNQVSIGVLSDGKIMCIYSQHNKYAKLALRISTNPEDISVFGNEISVEQPDGYQTQNYVQTFYVGGKWIALYRWYARPRNETESTYCAWTYRESTDGTNWSTEQYHLIGAGAMQYYGLFMQKDADTLKFYGYTNPDSDGDSKRIRYGEINFNTGDVKTVTLDGEGKPNGITSVGNLSELVNGNLQEGENGREPLYTFEKELFNPIYQSQQTSPKHNNRIYDATSEHHGAKENILLISDWETSEEWYDSDYIALKINDDYTVTQEVITKSGNAMIPYEEHQKSYYGGVTFADGTSKMVYLAKESEGVWYIEKWTHKDGQWQLVRVLDESETKLWKPTAVVGDMGVVLWNRGDYNSITNYDSVVTNIHKG